MKKILLTGFALACLATVSTGALAQKSTQQRTCINFTDNMTSLAYDKRKFDCGDLGSLTLKGMNDKGWRIMQIVSTANVGSNTNTYGNWYIETHTSWTVLIEK